MRICGRLSETTLGDVLGSLFRARVTGLIRLTELSGATAGRNHGIYFSRGEVVAVDTHARVLSVGEILRQRGLLDVATQRHVGLRLAAASHRKVGELLVEEFHISPDVVGAALRQQLRAKLDALFRLEDAMLSFHVACSLPKTAVLPLSPREYLYGRPRARDRGPNASGQPGAAPRRGALLTARSEALSLLGLDEDASVSDVTRAFRDLARHAHPDRHVRASDSERRSMEQRFAALSAAYHALMAQL